MSDESDNDPGFPESIIQQLEASFTEYMPEYSYIPRPLRHTDPAQSLGVFVVDWAPVPDSEQMGDQREPALNRYEIRIQLLVKTSAEIDGRMLYGVGCKKIRAILYRDPDLVVRLTALAEVVLGTRESVKRFGVRRQRFLNNEIKGSMMYLATTDFWVETESTKL